MSTRYKRHRFPVEIIRLEIIRHCVWLYYTFPLSYRDIKKIMLYRGIEVTYETIRHRCQKFAQDYAIRFISIAASARCYSRLDIPDWLFAIASPSVLDY